MCKNDLCMRSRRLRPRMRRSFVRPRPRCLPIRPKRDRSLKTEITSLLGTDSARLFLRARCPSNHTTNSAKALKKCSSTVPISIKNKKARNYEQTSPELQLFHSGRWRPGVHCIQCCTGNPQTAC